MNFFKKAGNKIKKGYNKAVKSFLKRQMKSQETIEAIKNPEILKPYFNKSDDEMKEIFTEQASHHRFKPFNSPYWHAYTYWLGYEAMERFKDKPKILKKLNKIGERATKKLNDLEDKDVQGR